MFDIQYYDTVESTMDIARDNLRHGLVIQAGEQTGGRGRRGNIWTSPHGNLYQSIILKPIIDHKDWGQLSFVIAIALGQTCLQMECTAVQLKWPNDVLVNGQKLAGILIEVQGEFVIIGTGVNIEHAPDGRAKIHDCADISVHDFRDAFLTNIDFYYHLWIKEGFNPIRDAWMALAYRLNEKIVARLHNKEYEGIFEDLDENGILLLRQKDGSVMQIHSGEILNVSGN